MGLETWYWMREVREVRTIKKEKENKKGDVIEVMEGVLSEEMREVGVRVIGISLGEKKGDKIERTNKHKIS